MKTLCPLRLGEVKKALVRLPTWWLGPAIQSVTRSSHDGAVVVIGAALNEMTSCRDLVTA